MDVPDFAFAQSGLHRHILRHLPFHVWVEWPDRARHVPPRNAREHRTDEPGPVHLDDLRVAENIIEAGTEVAARLDHKAAQRAQVDSQVFEHRRLEALVADRHEYHVDALRKTQPRRRTEL